MTGRTSRIGRHLPTSGGLKETLRRAEALGCETLQIFVSNPQGWALPTPRPDAKAFADGARELGLWPVVAHSKYLINLASPDAAARERSIEVLARELAAAEEAGVDLVVVHCGSHGGAGEEKGMERLAGGLLRARELAAVGSGNMVELAIENSVGAGTQLCSSFRDLGDVARSAGVKVCVDTAHAFASGYDLLTPRGTRGVAEELKAALGSSLALLHLNDAKNTLGSHRDGHRRIGEGQVPLECWSELFAALDGVPVVMETPYGTPEVDKEQILLVKKLASGLRNAVE